MVNKIGDFIIGPVRLSLYQDPVNGTIYHTRLNGSKETVTPHPNGTVFAFGVAAQKIIPLLPPEVLNRLRAHRTARK